MPPELAGSVDDALSRELASAGIRKLTVSPANYEALQLAVGCEGESRECLSSIAQTLQTEAILVRRLNVDSSGLTTLDLFYFDLQQQGEIASAQATVPADAALPVSAAVPRLVRKLFGIREPAIPSVASEPRPTQREPPPSIVPPSQASPAAGDEPVVDDAAVPSHGDSLRTWAWVTTLSGVAMLASGAVVGLTASGSFEDLKKIDPRTTADAQRIHRDFDSVETRATVANVLMPLGGAAIAAGAVMLLIDLSDDQPSTERATRQVQVVPMRTGALVTFHGSFGVF